MAPVTRHSFAPFFETSSDALIDALPVAVYVCDRDARIVGFNRRAVELWGREPSPDERFCGSLRMIRPDGSVLAHEACPMADVLRTGQAVRDGGVVVERPDGSRIRVNVAIVPLTDASGQVAGAINTFQDAGEVQRADEAAQRRAQDLHDFVENATDGLHWADPSGVILWANKADYDLLGYSRDEYVGHSLAEFHVDPDTVADMLARLSRREVLRNYEARLRCKDRSIRHVLVNASALWRNGEFIHTQAFTRDVTDLKHAEEALRDQLAALQRLAEASSQLIREDDINVLYEGILDAAAAVMHSEMASLQEVDEDADALRLLASRGFGPAFGETFAVVGPDTGTACSLARTLRQRVVIPDVELCDFMAGTAALQDLRKTAIRAVQSTPLISRADQLLGVISTHWREPHQPTEGDLRLLDLLSRQAADLIERTRTVATLRASEALLRRTSQLLEEAVRAREEFLSTAAHELRNPVNALQLQLVALLRATQGGDDAVSQAWACDRIGQAVAAVRRLAQLVEALLDVSRITAGRLDLETERMDLSQSIRAVVSRFTDQGHGQRLSIRAEPTMGVWDRLRVEQIVTNLLSNAIKYGEGLPIEIVLDSDDATVTVSVTDHGIGIDPADQQRLFERFERAVTRRQYGGFGLGLWITQQIVTVIGGHIVVESRLGEGSTFRVTLPRQPIVTAPHVTEETVS